MAGEAMSMAAAEKRIVEVLILMNSGLDGWMDGAVRCCCFSRRFLCFPGGRGTSTQSMKYHPS